MTVAKHCSSKNLVNCRQTCLRLQTSDLEKSGLVGLPFVWGNYFRKVAGVVHG